MRNLLPPLPWRGVVPLLRALLLPDVLPREPCGARARPLPVLPPRDGRGVDGPDYAALPLSGDARLRHGVRLARRSPLAPPRAYRALARLVHRAERLRRLLRQHDGG